MAWFRLFCLFPPPSSFLVWNIHVTKKKIAFKRRYLKKREAHQTRGVPATRSRLWFLGGKEGKLSYKTDQQRNPLRDCDWQKVDMGISWWKNSNVSKQGSKNLATKLGKIHPVAASKTGDKKVDKLCSSVLKNTMKHREPNAVESCVFSDDAIVVFSSWSCTAGFSVIFVMFVVAVTGIAKREKFNDGN